MPASGVTLHSGEGLQSGATVSTHPRRARLDVTCCVHCNDTAAEHLKVREPPQIAQVELEAAVVDGVEAGQRCV